MDRNTFDSVTEICCLPKDHIRMFRDALSTFLIRYNTKSGEDTEESLISMTHILSRMSPKRSDTYHTQLACSKIDSQPLPNSP